MKIILPLQNTSSSAIVQVDIIKNEIALNVYLLIESPD